MAIRSWVARVYLKWIFLVGGPSEDILKTKAFNLAWQWGELRFARLLGPMLNETM
ncbi:MAG: hypothetical protein E6939_07875 [Escherichia coli]|uniref:hypothetical protein n=1 Tax=Escherichia coli TaxID=562 RepID=UPI00197CAE2E|nr:hypothetical protein [Escherichia coli]EGI4039599.1 hypothetical protein [Escherichia coli]ELE9967230.1 hypothetical protein [Escherichia coli]MDU1369811.1 hypothetical protein [Escherichia coli]